MGRTTKGTCELCDAAFGKAAMSRHVAACALKDVLAGDKTEMRFHLLVEGRSAKGYWLHLAAKPGATLDALDAFLRRIWLECCGHLSSFTIGESSFDSHAEAGRSGMGRPLEKVLKPDMKFTYEYDFGSTTELCLKVQGTMEVPVSKKPITLLAQNDQPEIPCDVCKAAPAVQICTECDCQGKGWLCQACADDHECGEDYFLPVVNSPRAGVCGYCG